MLREASVSELHKKGISKTRRVLVNRGRGNDELAPSDKLYEDFNRSRLKSEKNLGRGSIEAHNKAFIDCDYNIRFREQVTKDPKALKRLKEIVKRSEKNDIYLICYEGPQKACHRRILLRIAEELFGAKVSVNGVEPT